MVPVVASDAPLSLVASSPPVAAGSHAANTPTAPNERTNLDRLFNCILLTILFVMSLAICHNSILFVQCKFS